MAGDFVEHADTDASIADQTPPGPTGLPYIGSTLSAARDGIAFGRRLEAYGDVVRYRAFGTEFVAIFDPQLVRQVLVDRNDEFRKGDFEAAFGERLAPSGLVFTEGDQWRRQRTQLQPAFRPNAIRSYGDAMVESAADWAATRAVGDRVDLGDQMSQLTLRILTRTLFDLDIDADRGQVVRDAVHAIENFTDALGTLSFLPDWVPSRTERRLDARMDALDELVDELIAETRQGSSNPADDSDTHDLLATMLQPTDESGGLDAGEVRDQLVTFLFAGHETTATALTYALWLLAGEPAVRDRLDAELEAVLEPGCEPNAADVPALSYTDAIVSEALRLYPPAFMLYRQPKRNLSLGGYRIPEETTLQLATYNIQRDPRWWDAPDAFNPARWLDDDGGRPEYAYFPFGGGPRHCIGMRFARMELVLVVATLARCLRFDRVTDTLDPSMRLTLDPGTVRLRVTERVDT